MKLGKGDPSKHLFIGKSVLTIPNIKATISGVTIKGYYIRGLISKATISWVTIKGYYISVYYQGLMYQWVNIKGTTIKGLILNGYYGRQSKGLSNKLSF